MDHDTFHNTVLQLANIQSIRYWNYYNYPQKPQEFAILFAHEAPDALRQELISMGFEYGEDGVFRISKTEESVRKEG